MKTRQLPSTNDPPILTVGLQRLIDGWILTNEVSNCSPRTIEKRKLLLSKFLWFLRDREIAEIDRMACRNFLHYVSHGHKEAGGRWGAGWTRETKPSTVNSFHGTLRAFFNWYREEEDRDSSPMDKVEPAINRDDQIQPFSDDQVDRLLRAAAASNHPKRDRAILLFLLDTGVRVSELCDMKLCDLDMMGYGATVTGKGDKTRRIQFGKNAKKALWQYLHARPHDPDEPLFIAEGGHNSGEELRPNGVLQMIRRLGKAAGIEGVRCSPHTFRHTFSIYFLRNGGNQFTLMTLLGHTSLDMTKRYVAIAQADVVAQHRQHSPVDRMMRK